MLARERVLLRLGASSVALRRKALLCCHNVGDFPTNDELQDGPIDVWWIKHDGGLLVSLKLPPLRRDEVDPQSAAHVQRTVEAEHYQLKTSAARQSVEDELLRPEEASLVARKMVALGQADNIAATRSPPPDH